MRSLIIISIAILLAGCSAVFSPAPVGDKPTNITSTQDEWEGTWTPPGESAPIVVRVIDGSNGVLQVDWIEKDQDKRETRTVSALLRDTGNWTFVSFKDKADGEAEQYLWARIKKKERMAILWPPDMKRFRTLVEAGTLPGVVDDGNVVLGTLNTNHMALIMSETNGVLFEWDDPMVLIKSGE